VPPEEGERGRSSSCKTGKEGGLQITRGLQGWKKEVDLRGYFFASVW
jgi:hypothetical protein